MKVTIVTVCRNASATISDCLWSVLTQEGVEVEYIVIDGDSTDQTMDMLRQHADQIAHLISEPDAGIYDAMNKGLRLATGDMIGFLNSDDVIASEFAIRKIVETVEMEKVDVVFGDVEIYNSKGKLVRVYRGASFKPSKMRSGHLPPHPSFYARTDLLRKAGGFKTSFKIAADFDIMMRIFSVLKPRWSYVPQTIVQMRSGGISSRGLSSYMTISRELLAACRSNDIQPSEFAIHARLVRKGLERAEALRLRVLGRSPSMRLPTCP